VIARLKSDAGQAMGMAAISLVALVAMTAFVLDIGSWFRADRQLQVVADAAALAGAQALPKDPAKALALAEEYAEENGGPAAEEMKIESDLVDNDTISVTYSDDAPGFFSQIVGIDSVKVRARASARASKPAGMRWVAPIVVNEKHPLLHCTAPSVCDPEFGVETTLGLINLHSPGSGDAAGAFGLINLQYGDKSGSVGASTLADWVDNGFNQTMKPGIYYSVPSAMYNSNEFKDAIDEKISTGDELLFPIYRTLKESGSNAEYDIIGWVSFVITNTTGGGSNAKVHGYFKEMVWEGVPASGGGGDDDDDDDDDDDETPVFGTYVVSLTK
jgi:hypothetical protein